MSASGIVIMSFSGEGIDTQWESITQGLISSMPNGITASSNDANHSITLTYNNFIQTLSDNEISELISGTQINQNGTKFKMSMGLGVGPGMGVELIYTKQ